MATVDVLSLDKKKIGSVELNKDVFEVPVKKTILHEVGRWQLACRRQGTSATKTVRRQPDACCVSPPDGGRTRKNASLTS